MTLTVSSAQDTDFKHILLTNIFIVFHCFYRCRDGGLHHAHIFILVRPLTLCSVLQIAFIRASNFLTVSLTFDERLSAYFLSYYSL